MDMIDVESSHIRAIGYDAAARVLAVRFGDGSTYHYHDVPPEEFASLGAAASKGRYLRAVIIPRYAGARVPDPPPPPDGPTGDVGRS